METLKVGELYLGGYWPLQTSLPVSPSFLKMPATRDSCIRRQVSGAQACESRLAQQAAQLLADISVAS
ncbi:hypothetical protein J2793_007264 [Paraburkholderia caledonica]|uniref:Uncharacterized protein n=1 Tax=Paraburkholderia caledonica TaxID=134536 RepID=A0AB73IP63_9BURK|nr:hypothetical protein [Paraburkholderia caledonica]